jgi:hypothetical protein
LFGNDLALVDPMPSFSQTVSIFLVGVFVAAKPACGGEKLVRPDNVPEGWSVFAERLPPVFAPRAASSGVNPDVPPELANFHLMQVGKSGRGGTYDVKEWLRESGINLPKNGLALYRSYNSMLVCIGPAKDIEAIEALSMRCDSVPIDVRVTATLAEMHAPQRAKLQGLPYRRLRSIAEGSWKELEQTQIRTKSGQRAVTRKRQTKQGIETVERSDDERDVPPLAQGETGVSLEVEPVSGIDGDIVDLSLVWLRRNSVSAMPQELESITSMSIRDGEPVVANLWPADSNFRPANGSQRMRTLVLVVTADLVSPEGTPAKLAIAKQIREFRKETVGK